MEVCGECGTGWAGKVTWLRVPLPPAEPWLSLFVKCSAEEVEKVGQAVLTNTSYMWPIQMESGNESELKAGQSSSEPA